MLADILGVLGFFLAVLSVSWEIWKYRHDQKEMLHICRPGVLYGPSTENGTLTATVVNTGRVPIYIANISLYWEDEDGSTGLGMVPSRWNAGIDPKAAILIEPGEGREFVVNGLRNDNINEALSSKVWISVSTYKGELARMEGESLKFMLVQLLEYRKRSAEVYTSSYDPREKTN